MNDWKKGFDPNQIVNKLEQCRHIDAQVRVTFKGFEFHEYRVILTEMFESSKSIPNADKSMIVLDAITNVGKLKKITATKLRREIVRLTNKYQSKPDIQYMLMCSISIKDSINLRRRRINHCTITFYSNLDKRLYKAYKKQMDIADQFFNWKYPTDYLYAKIHVTAKTPAQATEKALRTFDLLRGLWNLEINRTSGRISLGGLIKPINQICYGPLETLHFKNGKIATKVMWYQPEFQVPLKAYDKNTTLNKIFKYETKTRNLILKHNYKADIEECIIRYVQALDLYNLQDSFIRLWGILETLTGKGFQTQQSTIKRTTFHYLSSSQEYVYQLLNILKEYRNHSVHMGTNSENIETLVFILKRFVEVLLYFHINNKFCFDNMDDATEFFDLSQSKEEFEILKKSLDNLKKYKKW